MDRKSKTRQHMERNRKRSEANQEETKQEKKTRIELGATANAPTINTETKAMKKNQKPEIERGDKSTMRHIPEGAIPVRQMVLLWMGGPPNSVGATASGEKQKIGHGGQEGDHNMVDDTDHRRIETEKREKENSQRHRRVRPQKAGRPISFG